MQENKPIQLPWEDDFDLEAVDPVTEKPRFVIDDLGKANWALKKIAAMRSELASVDSLANAEIDKIKAWQTKEKTRINSEIRSFETRLRPFAEAVVAGKKKKSVNCPNGLFGFRSKAADFEIINDSKLLKDIKRDCPEFVRIKEEIAWGDFKKSLQLIVDEETQKQLIINSVGQPIENVRYVPEQITFYTKGVKTDGKCESDNGID